MDSEVRGPTIIGVQRRGFESNCQCRARVPQADTHILSGQEARRYRRSVSAVDSEERVLPQARRGAAFKFRPWRLMLPGTLAAGRLGWASTA